MLLSMKIPFHSAIVMLTAQVAKTCGETHDVVMRSYLIIGFKVFMQSCW